MKTGRKVAIIAVMMATAIRTTNERGPKTKSEAPIPAESSAFIKVQRITLPTDERIMQITLIKKDSEKKILNTSVPLAPTALRIPISLFFCDIETEIKLEKRSAANTAITRPTYKNTCESDFTVSSTILKFHTKFPVRKMRLASSRAVSFWYIFQ